MTIHDISGPLHGIIIYSSVEKGSIIGHSRIEKGEPFILLDSSDVIGTNTVTIDQSTIPLLGGYDIKYRGEPVLVLFGPSLESVQRRAKSIEIEYQAIPDEETYSLKEHTPVSYAWGKKSVLDAEGLTPFSTSFTFDRHTFTRDSSTITAAHQDGKRLVIETSTQWPFHALDTVATTCGRTKKSICIQNRNYHSSYDEYLISPSIHASIAALAVLHTGKSVVLHTNESHSSSCIKTERTTYLDSKGIPVAEQCRIELDQGAYPLFRGELVVQMLAGLTPPYPVKFFSAEFTSVESHLPPTHFYGTLGFTEAIFFTESHVSALAREQNKNPSNWRINHYGEYRQRQAFIAARPLSELKDLISTVGTDGDFSRHHAVYEIQSRSGDTLSPFLNYARGIGIACAPGISGFSLKSKLHKDAKIRITLDKNKVIVNSSFYPNMKTRKLWFSVIAKQLSVPIETIETVNNKTDDMIDTGPEVLSVDVGRSIEMLTGICAAIQSKRFQEPLPITESVTARSILPAANVKFISENWGCLSLELEIDTITLETYARRVVGRFTFSHVMNTVQLSLKFRRVIHETLSTLDIIPVHRNDAPPLIDVQVFSSEDGAYPSSATQSIRGMVYAAYVSACSQALGTEVTSLFSTYAAIDGQRKES